LNTGLVAVAHLVRARGIRGELAAIPLNNRRERFGSLQRAIVRGAEYELERVWWHRDELIIKFRGIDTRTQAEELAGADACIPASERAELPEGEFYLSDLIGCEVLDKATGRRVGVVAGWQETGGATLLELEGSGTLIPFARSICREIDIAARRILIDPPEGLLDLNA